MSKYSRLLRDRPLIGSISSVPREEPPTVLLLLLLLLLSASYGELVLSCEESVMLEDVLPTAPAVAVPIDELGVVVAEVGMVVTSWLRAELGTEPGAVVEVSEVDVSGFGKGLGTAG